VVLKGKGNKIDQNRNPCWNKERKKWVKKSGNQPKLMLILGRALGKHFSFLMVHAEKKAKHKR
jgi:hypothetical protein